MKRTLLLTLSLVILANTIGVNSAQAIDWQKAKKHAWTGLKLAIGITCTVMALQSFTTVKHALSTKDLISSMPVFPSELLIYCSNAPTPRIPTPSTDLSALTKLFWASSILAGTSFKSAYDDITTKETTSDSIA